MTTAKSPIISDLDELGGHRSASFTGDMKISGCLGSFFDPYETVAADVGIR